MPVWLILLCLGVHGRTNNCSWLNRAAVSTSVILLVSHLAYGCQLNRWDCSKRCFGESAQIFRRGNCILLLRMTGGYGSSGCWFLRLVFATYRADPSNRFWLTGDCWPDLIVNFHLLFCSHIFLVLYRGFSHFQKFLLDWFSFLITTKVDWKFGLIWIWHLRIFLTFCFLS